MTHSWCLGLSWGCRPEHLPTASQCTSAFSQCGTKGSPVSWETVSQEQVCQEPGSRCFLPVKKGPYLETGTVTFLLYFIDVSSHRAWQDLRTQRNKLSLFMGMWQDWIAKKACGMRDMMKINFGKYKPLCYFSNTTAMLPTQCLVLAFLSPEMLFSQYQLLVPSLLWSLYISAYFQLWHYANEPTVDHFIWHHT